MLVLTRKIGEQLQIGDDVVVTIVRIGDGGIRIGIEAPPEYSIVREELMAGDPEPQPAVEPATVASDEKR